MTFLTDIAARQRAALQQFNVVQIGDVDEEQISLDLAYTHCAIDTYEDGSPPETVSDFDAWLTDVGIPAAREYCEAYLGLSLAPRTLELSSNAFPAVAVSSPPGPAFVLPFGPVQSITSITYMDEAAYTAAYDAEFLISGDVDLATAAGEAALLQTVDPTTYQLGVYGAQPIVVLAYGESWPTSRNAAGSVKVRYVAGFNLSTDSPLPYPLPKMAKVAMLLMLGHLFNNREGVSGTVGGALLHELPLGIQSLLSMIRGVERLGMA